MPLRIIELCTDRLPCPPLKGGAIESYVYGISRAMRKLGAEVHLATIEARKDVDYGGIIVHSVDLLTPIATEVRKFISLLDPMNRGIVYRNIPYLTARLFKLFSEVENLYGEVDVIHSHYFATSFAPLIYKYFKRREALIVGHLHNEPKCNIVNKKLIELYDLNLAVSKYVKHRTIELLKVNPNKIGVVYNTVDTEFFKPCKSSERMEKRKIFGVEDEFTIVFVGRIVPEKGLHHLILASKILKQKGYKFKLLIAGPLGHFDMEILKGYPSYCFNLIYYLGLSNNVKYMGKPEKEELRDIYCASDLISVPSLWEDPCPTVALEAMAMGRPVVAYASGGIPEIVPPYGGIVIKKDPKLLAEAIEMVIQGSFSFNESATIVWTRNRFSYQAVAQKLLKTFEKMQGLDGYIRGIARGNT
jgi:spore coat protein SA